MSTLTLNQPKLNWNAQLTEREQDICEQVTRGCTREEVAEMFYISIYAVIETIRRVFRKTGARNIAELSALLWCRQFHATMVISEGKRKIVTLSMILLIIASEFTSQSELRSRRSRRSKDEYECIAEGIDFKAPEYITL